MYELQTLDAIMQRMLNQVPNDIDKREGSLIYDALAPAALELAELYGDLDRNRELSFASTSSGEYLDRRTAEFGVLRAQATKARRKGLFYGSSNTPIDVPIGSRFSNANVNYVAIERLAEGQFILECEITGVVGNQHFGSMLPIDYITNLVSAELSDVLIPGEEVESDNSLRLRFLERARKPGTSGNKADYLQWALEVPGIGGVQVEPIWNGPGTVRVFILDTEKRAPAALLVQEVQEHIAPDPHLGEGKAPIGADVTVAPAVEIPINIGVQLTLASGADLSQVRTAIENEVRNYLKQLAFSESLVRYSRISGILLDIPGIVDFAGLIVNGGTANPELQLGQVAVLGAVSIDE